MIVFVIPIFPEAAIYPTSKSKSKSRRKSKSKSKSKSKKQELQLDHLRGTDVLARADFFEQSFIRRRVEIEDGQRGASRLVPAERHRRDIYSVVAEHGSDST